MDATNEANTCLYLGNLSRKCTKFDLFELFSNFGEISDIQIQRQPEDMNNRLTYAFVRYLFHQDAVTAKNEANNLKFLDGLILK